MVILVWPNADVTWTGNLSFVVTEALASSSLTNVHFQILPDEEITKAEELCATYLGSDTHIKQSGKYQNDSQNAVSVASQEDPAKLSDLNSTVSEAQSWFGSLRSKVGEGYGDAASSLIENLKIADAQKALRSKVEQVGEGYCDAQKAMSEATEALRSKVGAGYQDAQRSMSEATELLRLKVGDRYNDAKLGVSDATEVLRSKVGERYTDAQKAVTEVAEALRNLSDSRMPAPDAQGSVDIKSVGNLSDSGMSAPSAHGASESHSSDPEKVHCLHGWVVMPSLKESLPCIIERWANDTGRPFIFDYHPNMPFCGPMVVITTIPIKATMEDAALLIENLNILLRHPEIEPWVAMYDLRSLSIPGMDIIHKVAYWLKDNSLSIRLRAAALILPDDFFAGILKNLIYTVLAIAPAVAPFEFVHSEEDALRYLMKFGTSSQGASSQNKDMSKKPIETEVPSSQAEKASDADVNSKATDGNVRPDEGAQPEFDFWGSEFSMGWIAAPPEEEKFVWPFGLGGHRTEEERNIPKQDDEKDDGNLKQKNSHAAESAPEAKAEEHRNGNEEEFVWPFGFGRSSGKEQEKDIPEKEQEQDIPKKEFVWPFGFGGDTNQNGSISHAENEPLKDSDEKKEERDNARHENGSQQFDWFGLVKEDRG
eukprot:gnl/MRDRNA2_/MRDRNA2_69933_c0_seq1.p1 gnl/MRDRNA2_/MRDRNA2_69933_c0~~gnl/MRDRNA2_/MRDRNA2_69933_c0_seq1.p1  ORF type:complete len:704 (-),score=143.55 gnl/MRDRNA2_/MRDRNA2_69933_c0_seq1:9-1967(-)